ncbi:tetraacyldisaccharide 4'-kinase [Rhodobacterales bacterium 52_120_T64]|nr:tetraacyldisaccharide 4'-kinase [Rhodobacterales bacterium 52_120_T64]
MRPPLFWNRPHGLASHTLAPLEWVWTTATRRRLKNGPWERLTVPVICVGNINVGGTGKTPTVIALLEIFSDIGVTAHVVSRGHGGSELGPLMVDERKHSADKVGDEPILISAFGPCWIAKDRTAGAKAAIAAGAQVILLDDGFQNPSLHKDLGLVVVDAEIGFGNGRVMPAGPLREPLVDGLSRADFVIPIGPPAAQKRVAAQLDNPVWCGELRALETGMDWSGTRFIAFAGIGRPGKFFGTLQGLGANIVATHAFSDHAPYTDAILQRLKAEAKAKTAQLVTTEKDMARLPAEFRRGVLALPVRLVFNDLDAVKKALVDLASGLAK